jgi:hypothetical protein
MHHIVFASHAWHLHHCAFLSYQLMVPEAEQQIYADRPTVFFPQHGHYWMAMTPGLSDILISIYGSKDVVL